MAGGRCSLGPQGGPAGSVCNNAPPLGVSQKEGAVFENRFRVSRKGAQQVDGVVSGALFEVSPIMKP